MSIFMGGMILHVMLKLSRSNGHQHEQNDEDYAQPPASHIECRSCRETN